MTKRKGWRGQSKRHGKAARGIKTGRKKRPKKIGSVWKGEEFIHGPRMHPPSRYSKFRLGKPMKTGERFVFGKVKGTNKWEIQSKLTPRNFGNFLKQIKRAERSRFVGAVKRRTTEQTMGLSPIEKARFTRELEQVRHSRKQKQIFGNLFDIGGKKKKFKIKEENFGDWTDIDKWQFQKRRKREIEEKRRLWLEAKELREAVRRTKEKQERLE